MSGHPWYKRYGADFVHGTMGLTLEEKGAYSLCLDLIYDRGGPIPDDARWLAGICGVSVRKWASLRERLIETGKLVASDGTLMNSRAISELENAAKISRKHAENGAKGGNKRAENARDVNENNDMREAGLKHRARDQKPEEIREDTSSNEDVARARRAPPNRAVGTRLGRDWTPPPADEQFAISLGLGDRLDAVLGDFRDYWCAVPGAKGLKLDWPATYRNHCRRVAERLPRGPPRNGHPPRAKEPAPLVSLLRHLESQIDDDRQSTGDDARTGLGGDAPFPRLAFDARR